MGSEGGCRPAGPRLQTQLFSDANWANWHERRRAEKGVKTEENVNKCALFGTSFAAIYQQKSSAQTTDWISNQ